jgi:hypothetical protein
VYYTLQADEQASYQKILSGLGLDKTYAIKITDGSKFIYIYRDKSDIMYTPQGKEISVGVIQQGQKIQYNKALAQIVSISDRERDGTYHVRMMKAQQATSQARNKLLELTKIIEQFPGEGMLIYFSYLASVDTVYHHLLKTFPGRRVVVLTGKTKDFDMVVRSLMPQDIVLLTRVAQQSLNFYFKRMIIYEMATNPGSIEQLFGRVTREDSPFREIDVFVLMRAKCVEEYCYERLRYLLRTNKTNVYSMGLPVGKTCEGIPEDLIDISFLKEQLLWRREFDG